MFNAIKKGLVLGIGAASLTKEAAEKRVAALVKRGAITRRQGQLLTKRLFAAAKKERARLRDLVSAEARKAARQARKEIAKARAKAIALERRLRATAECRGKEVLARQVQRAGPARRSGANPARRRPRR
ncbi:hypothetical protein JXB02_03005 [Candidatus Woesearchaeota archaeon]|nr:hypothetical protein [Candidatus Woesearchaeota archaeon]